MIIQNNLQSNSKESINPFTGFTNAKSMQLQNSWEKILNDEYGPGVFSGIDFSHKLKKSNLYSDSFEYKLYNGQAVFNPAYPMHLNTNVIIDVV